MEIKPLTAKLVRLSINFMTMQRNKLMVFGLGLALVAWYAVLTPGPDPYNFTLPYENNHDFSVITVRLFAGLFFYAGLFGYFRQLRQDYLDNPPDLNNSNKEK